MSETPRPFYHFTPFAGWMNDPNGLVIYEQERHLFYQAVPPGAQGKHWGHAVSRDGVNWEHLPIALAPDELGEIWSGSAVADRGDTSEFFDGNDRGGLVAIFTHASASAQVQSLAWSRDRGRTWTKYEHNPVLTSTSHDFRDPKVFWHHGKNRWTMILAVGDRAEIYSSPDLKTWTLASEFGRDRLAGYGTWECPDLVKLLSPRPDARELWVLIASITGPGEPVGRCETRYWLGFFDGEKFEADDTQPWIGSLLDHGPDHYASVTWDGDYLEGTRTSIGWMSRWAYADRTPTVGWRGVMTIPRNFSTVQGGRRLTQIPASDFRSLYHLPMRRFGLVAANSGTHDICADTGEAYEVNALVQCATARRCGLRLRMSARTAGPTELTEVGYDDTTGCLYMDRTLSGKVDFYPGFAGQYEAPVTLRPGRTLKLQIFVDRCSVEIFAQDGEAVITALIFPAAESQGLSFFAEAGSAAVGPADLLLMTCNPAHYGGGPS